MQKMKRSSALITSHTFLRRHSVGYNLFLRKYSVAPASFLLTCTSKKKFCSVQASQQIIFNTAATYAIREKLLICKEEILSNCFNSLNLCLSHPSYFKPHSISYRAAEPWPQNV